MDTEQIKTAIRAELGRKVAMSGGPEVFRRLVRGPSPLVETALQELVAEGLLSETRLRVGRIYHYPANTAVRLDILAGFMKKAAEAPARPARDPNAPRPARAAPGTVRPGSPPPSSAPRSDPSGEDLAGVRTASASSGADEADAVRTPATRVTGSQADDPPIAAGEKPAWVPQKATRRDPNKPRPVPRTPASVPPAAAAVADTHAKGLPPEREPEGLIHAAETAGLTAGPPNAPEKAGLPPAAELPGASGEQGAAHDTPARAGQPPGLPTVAELTEPAPPAPGQEATAPRAQETPDG